MNDKGTDQTTYCIEGSEVYNKVNQHYYITLEVVFAYTNSVGSDEMSLFAKVTVCQSQIKFIYGF